MTPKSILVVQLRRIGDVILTTPALRALRKRFPEARLDILVEPPGAEALRGLPWLDGVLVYDARGPLEAFSWAKSIRAREYDWVIDLMGNPRTAMITAMSGARLKAGPGHVFHRWAYGVKLPQSTETCYAAEEKIRMLAPLGVPATDDVLPRLALAERDLAGNVVALAPASRKRTRRWPADKYAALGRLLREKLGCELLVLWGPGERPLAEEVARGAGEGARVSPETKTLADAARLLASCRLLVTNCSGTKHLAVAHGVPTVTVHSSSDPKAWNPPAAAHPFVRREELHCIGCRLNDCPYNLECLRDLEPERVLEACLKALASEVKA